MSTSIPVNDALSGTTILVNIKDIKGFQLQSGGIFKKFDKFYVELVIDGQVMHKTGNAKGNTASWAESFYFNAQPSSMLECRVYAQHKIGSNDFIGAAKEKIEHLLSEGASGVITRQLCNDKLYRNSQTTVQFTIAAISGASDVAALNMEEVIAQGNDAIGCMKTPRVEAPVTVIQDLQSVLSTWTPLLQNIQRFSDIVHTIAEIHPYANMAWSILSAIPKTILAQVDRDSCIIRLVGVINDVYSFVEEAEPMKKIESHRRIISLMAQQTTECAYFIRDYASNKSFWERALKNSFMSDVDRKIKEYMDKFQELKIAFQDRAVLQTGITVSRILHNLESLAVDFELNDMPYAKGARFEPEKGCLPGTRETIIGEIVQWINSPNEDTSHRLFFLSALAGYGKSAVAHTVATQFDELGRLGSSYCFDRADQANRHPSNLLSTIALDIGDLDQHWKKSLCDVVKGNRSLRTTRSAAEQFKNFILEPAKALTMVGPIVIVIDALDESGDSSFRRTLLEILVRRAADLPPNFRILITARPETDILNALSGNPCIRCRHLDDIDKSSNEHDISLFIETMLSDIPSLELEWPNKYWCGMLLKASDGLFQWASTACRAIKDGEGGLWPTELLTRFCSLTRGLDALYLEVLSRSFNSDDSIVMSRFKSVMGRILVAKEPLSIAAHSDMCLGTDDARLVRLVAQSMGSLLTGVNQPHTPVRALHASFFDFLADNSRSKTYYVDASEQNWNLTLSTFRVMKKELRFNICGLETSHLKNTDVPDLNMRVANTILPHLSYGCRFWADHLKTTTYDSTILAEVRDFLLNRLLYWFEVLSLIKNINVASRMLLSMLEWNQDKNDAIMSFANDAINFVSAFGPAISKSAPHIYISALPLAPENSQVAKHYLPLFSKTLRLKMGQQVEWPAIIGVLEGHSNCVTSVAMSQDSKCIVSGSRDLTICMWDVETGEIILGPLTGHTDYINSVAFSPDCNRIVSGSSDNTVCIWNATTGEVAVGPLVGHNSCVNSVAFSPDGKRIISGSSDQTVRVWDAETGDSIIGPLQGHTGFVTSIAISH